jgi:DNA-binding HxlR family transcriptional regulator
MKNLDCGAVSELLSRVGDKWTVLIVKSLVARPCRFNELKRDAHPHPAHTWTRRDGRADCPPDPCRRRWNTG